MDVYNDREDPKIRALLTDGAVGVLKTDTLYGVVASVKDVAAVERVYEVRGRDTSKPCIVLIADQNQMYDVPKEPLASFLAQHWPGPVSVIVPSPHAPEHLTRGGDNVAYRVPADDELRTLLAATGPLVAPSANPQGAPPARDIAQAQAYFGDSVDFYVDSGAVQDTTPSQLWAMKAGKMERLR